MTGAPSKPPSLQDCEHCPHHHVDVMGATPETERARLLQFFRLRQYAVREVIYAEGEPGVFVSVVRRGLVKLTLYSRSGAERIVRLAMPGDTIGLELMLDGRFHHTAIALTPVELCLMPRDVVDERVNTVPDFARKVMAEWHASVDDAERFLTDLSTGTAHERVARLLLYLHERGAGGRCPLIGREDMGALLGITMETTSRVVAEFKREGLLQEDAHEGWRCDNVAVERVAGRRGPANASPAP